MQGYKNKTGVLSIQDIEDAITKSLDNFGAPDKIFMPTNINRSMRMTLSSGNSETCRKIHKHFQQNPELNMDDFDIMNDAAKAFKRVGLDKDKYPLGYTIVQT